MNKINYGNNMMLFTSFWGDYETFRMMPVTEDCPYAEVIYNPAVATLVVISKIRKQNFQFIPKLNPNGDAIPTKGPRPNGKTYQEQRTTIELLQEYYITEKVDQIAFIQAFAINADKEKFDFEKYLRDIEEEKQSGIMQVEKKPLVDKTGQPIKVKK